MKAISLILSFVMVVTAQAEEKKIWEMTAEEYCSQGDGKIEEGKCIFPEKFTKGDGVIEMINTTLSVEVNQTYVLESNNDDCLVQWSSSGVTDWTQGGATLPVYGELVFINLDPTKVYQKGPNKGQTVGVGVPLDRFWVAKDVTYRTQSVDFGIESENGFYVETSIKVAGTDKYTMQINAEGDAAFGLLFLKNAEGEKVSLQQYCEIEF